MSSETVLLARFLQRADGELARAQLEAFDVPCRLSDDSAVGELSRYFLYVRAEDEERANELLEADPLDNPEN